MRKSNRTYEWEGSIIPSSTFRLLHEIKLDFNESFGLRKIGFYTENSYASRCQIGVRLNSGIMPRFNNEDTPYAIGPHTLVQGLTMTDEMDIIDNGLLIFAKNNHTENISVKISGFLVTFK